MKALEKVSGLVGKYMALIVLFVAAVALFMPSALNWIKTSWVNYLLMIVMFGMGLTMRSSDFKVVFSKPKDVFLGCIMQFTIMPLLAFGLGRLFRLEEALLVGVVLVGTCPGGTSSNVMTFLGKGDIALSIGMTSVSTLLAPILTPAITYFLLRATVDVNVVGMFISIIQVVIVPIGLGLVINHYFEKVTTRIEKVLPLISVTAIVMIVAAVVSANSAKILSTGAIVFVVVMLHNCLGYLLGYTISKLLGLDLAKCKAMSIEVGMQNSGLASGLAGQAFPSMALATVPGAVFSVWHNISGAILANIYRNMKDKNESDAINASAK